MLNLLTDDGAVCVCFKPALSPEQYQELIAVTEASPTIAELDRAVRALSREVGEARHRRPLLSALCARPADGS
jgi:hypothetical protein